MFLIKVFKKFLKNLHCSEEHVIQGPGENAGIVDMVMVIAFLSYRIT